MRQNKGFSLVELMIVVAIIGILAAIAIPNFVAMQYKAKRAEVPGNVDGIKTAQLSYEASFDAFVDSPTQPRADASLDKTAIAWAGYSGFSTVAWAPDGEVRGNYAVDESGAPSFLVTGKCDVDNDDVVITYTANHDSSNLALATNATLVAGQENDY